MLFYLVSEFGVSTEIEKIAQPQLLLIVFLNSTFDILYSSFLSLAALLFHLLL